MSYIILPKAVQQQPVRCNSNMPRAGLGTKHYYIYVGVRPVGEWDWGQGCKERVGALPPLKHLPLYLLVNLPKGDPRHSPMYPMLLLGSATHIISGYIAKFQQ